MDEYQIKEIIQKDNLLRAGVWGVFARNELPPLLLPGGYIINTEDRGKPGQHWVATYVPSVGPVEFVDSFGKPPEEYGLYFNCIYSSRQLQPLSSNKCALYALYYIFWRCRGVPMHDIINTLNMSNNDSIIQNFSFLV